MEGDDTLEVHHIVPLRISIHALRVEGDYVLNATDKTIIEFLSTPSGWRATSFMFAKGALLSISIHALRVEGDFCYNREYGN